MGIFDDILDEICFDLMNDRKVYLLDKFQTLGLTDSEVTELHRIVARENARSVFSESEIEDSQ